MTAAQPHRIGRSIGAVLAGFFAVAVLSVATDQLFHMLDVYPPWDQPMRESSDNLLALAYRCAYTVAGGYLTARLAPRNPMRHVLILGAAGFVMALLGAIAAIPMDLGPAWFPISLVVTAIPCTWLGGALYAR